MRWRKPRPIQVVALVVSVLAAGSVLVMFNRMSGFMGRGAKAESPLIATIDLRIGNPEAAKERGEKQAREDIEAGVLKLQTFGMSDPPTSADVARAERLKQRYGIVWINRSAVASETSQAYADAYNRLAEAEIERRHGKAVLNRLMHGEDSAFPKVRTVVTP